MSARTVLSAIVVVTALLLTAAPAAAFPAAPGTPSVPAPIGVVADCTGIHLDLSRLRSDLSGRVEVWLPPFYIGGIHGLYPSAGQRISWPLDLIAAGYTTWEVRLRYAYRDWPPIVGRLPVCPSPTAGGPSPAVPTVTPGTVVAVVPTEVPGMTEVPYLPGQPTPYVIATGQPLSTLTPGVATEPVPTIGVSTATAMASAMPPGPTVTATEPPPVTPPTPVPTAVEPSPVPPTVTSPVPGPTVTATEPTPVTPPTPVPTATAVGPVPSTATPSPSATSGQPAATVTEATPTATLVAGTATRAATAIALTPGPTAAAGIPTEPTIEGTTLTLPSIAPISPASDLRLTHASPVVGDPCPYPGTTDPTCARATETTDAPATTPGEDWSAGSPAGAAEVTPVSDVPDDGRWPSGDLGSRDFGPLLILLVVAVLAWLVLNAWRHSGMRGKVLSDMGVITALLAVIVDELLGNAIFESLRQLLALLLGQR